MVSVSLTEEGMQLTALIICAMSLFDEWLKYYSDGQSQTLLGLPRPRSTLQEAIGDRSHGQPFLSYITYLIQVTDNRVRLEIWEKMKQMIEKMQSEKEVILHMLNEMPSLLPKYLLRATPGFKFQPTDEEIIFYLANKDSYRTTSLGLIIHCDDFYSREPRHLPQADSIKDRNALYYLVLIKKKTKIGFCRTCPRGFWRAAFGDHRIQCETDTGAVMGLRKTLNHFMYDANQNQKSSKNRKKTDWMMHEYRLDDSKSIKEPLDVWTICKITWTGKNTKVSHDFSRERSIGPSEMVVQQNSTTSIDWLKDYCDNIQLSMPIQNEGALKKSEIEDSEQEEIPQTNNRSIGDELGTWTQERRVESREPSSEITMNEVEIEGAVPQQFRNPVWIANEFEPSNPEGAFGCTDNYQYLIDDFHILIECETYVNGMEDENLMVESNLF